MRRIPFQLAVLTLFALAFVSCKKDDKPAATGDMMTFTGRIGGGAKTEINGFEMTWSENDKVRINGEVFDSELTSDRKTATFTGEVLMPPYEAYYPTSLYNETENKYVLPATQHYSGDNGKVLSDVSPMYAKSATTDLTFHNICAMIRLEVTGEDTVKAVKVSSATPLSGEFEIKGDATNGFYAQLKPSSSKADHDTLTLDCGDGVELNADKDTTFYVAVPKGEYTDLVFTFVGSDGLTWSSDAVNHALEAGKLYTKTLADVKFVKPVPEPLPGEFTINSGGTKVKFSRGNLTYNVGAEEWAFYENQTDHATVYDDKLISLFTWGYGSWSTDPSTKNYQTGEVDGIFKDWGKVFGDDSEWRTLSKDEWKYLIYSRNGALSSEYFGKTCQWVTVGSTKGLLLYPDGYSGTKPAQSATIDVIPAGCVFLPAAGYRDGTSVYDVGSYGYYWSSSPYSTDDAYYLDFNSGSVYPVNYDYRYGGLSVRLVQEVNN